MHAFVVNLMQSLRRYRPCCFFMSDRMHRFGDRDGIHPCDEPDVLCERLGVMKEYIQLSLGQFDCHAFIIATIVDVQNRL
jgi:hypothetical protein